VAPANGTVAANGGGPVKIAPVPDDMHQTNHIPAVGQTAAPAPFTGTGYGSPGPLSVTITAPPQTSDDDPSSQVPGKSLN